MAAGSRAITPAPHRSNRAAGYDHHRQPGHIDMASLIQLRLLDFATEIATSPPEDFAFTHSVLAQAALPTARPPDDVRKWERRQGRATLLVTAGSVLDPRTGQFVPLPLPYGPKARLLLIHLNTEAVRRQSPIIPVEDSMTAFFRRLMGRTQDGRQVRMLKSQRCCGLRRCD
jgi:hypothetical protein